MKQKIMITGAAGFIGSQLAYRLWKQGAELVLVDNFSYGSPDNLAFPDHDFNDEVVQMDIRNADGMALLMAGGLDYIYHIAGIAPLPDCQIDPVEAVGVNVGGTVNLLEIARSCGVKKFIFASTNALYENETEFPTVESNFSLPTLVYPNTKYAAERFCQSYWDCYGLPVTCLRFANVYGPHIDCLRKQPPFVGYLIRELFYGRTPVFHSTGEQRRDYVYIDDLVDMALAAQNGTGFDCVNVSANQNYSVNEIYALAQRLMGKDIPADFASNEAYWNKYGELYGGAYPIKPELLAREVNKTSLCENAYAKEKYGWAPKVGMEEGLKRTIAYETELLGKLEAAKAGKV